MRAILAVLATILAAFLALVALAALGFFGALVDFGTHAFFAPRYEEVRRQTFDQSGM